MMAGAAVAGLGGLDVTAPTLSGASDDAASATTASLGVSTNEANGTLYWVVSSSATPPSAAQVKAGQMHTGAAAAASGSQAVSATGVQVATATGLVAATTYYGHLMHEDAAANQSSVASGDGFTTTVFDPSGFGLDALTNKYGIFSPAYRMLTAYSSTGNLVRLRRSADDAEANFAAVYGTGLLDEAAVAAWGGASTLYCTTLYDQSGNGRDVVQTTASKQPTLILTGSVPYLQFDGTDDALDGISLAGFARNVGTCSILAVCRYSGATTNVVQFGNGDGTGVRLTIQRHTSGFRAVGRRLDADSNATTSAITGDANWGVHMVGVDWTNNDAYHRREASAATSTSFSTAGSTSDTDSTAVALGSGTPANNFLNGGATLWVFTRDLLSGTPASDLVTSLAGLKVT